MNSDLIFQLSNNLALISWIVLIFFPFKSWTPKWILGTSISLLSLLYAYLAIATFDPDTFSQFGSLEGIMALFTHKEAVLAGWIHYLAFDLMVGLYIITQAKTLSLNRWLLIPSLLLTFMLGPLGLVVFLIYRFTKTKTLFHY